MEKADNSLSKTKVTQNKESASQYQRILIIDKLIASGRHPNLKDLREELERQCCKGGTSRATIYRDLKMLKDDFNAPLVLTDEGYEYSEKSFRIPALFTTESQIKAARVMRNLIDCVKGTQIYDDAKEVFTTLSTVAPVINNVGQVLKDTTLDESESDIKRIIFLGAPNVSFSSEVWISVKSAVENNQIISFNYKALYESEDSRRTIEPWQLVFSEGAWFVWGLDYYDYIVKLFSVSSINNIELRTEQFTLPSDFDFRNTTPGSFGCFTSPIYKTYKIHLFGSVAQTAALKIWGNNQQIEKGDDNSILLSFESNQHAPILNWVMSWGADAVPLEPKDFVQEWKSKVENAFNQVRKTVQE